MGILVQVLLTAVAVWASTLVDGIDLTGGTTGSRIFTLIAVAVIFGLVNAIVKPVVKFFGCVFYLLTLGLFGLVVNALLFMLTGWLAEQFDLPFRVEGFWAAFWGAIIVALTGWLLNVVYEKVVEKD